MEEEDENEEGVQAIYKNHYLHILASHNKCLIVAQNYCFCEVTIAVIRSEYKKGLDSALHCRGGGHRLKVPLFHR